MYSNSLMIANYCQLLTNSKQIKFGTLSSCLQIGKLTPKIQEEFEALTKLAKERNATDDELSEEIKELDTRWFSSFPKLKKSLVEDFSSEILAAFSIDGKPAQINVLEILATLDSHLRFENK